MRPHEQSNAGLLAARRAASLLFGVIVGTSPEADKVRRLIAEAQQKLLAPATSRAR